MAAYRRVYDSRHLARTRIGSGTLRSVIEYGLPLPLSSPPTFQPRLPVAPMDVVCDNRQEQAVQAVTAAAAAAIEMRRV